MIEVIEYNKNTIDINDLYKRTINIFKDIFLYPDNNRIDRLKQFIDETDN